MKGKGPGSAVKIGVIRSWGQPIGNKFSFGSKVLSSINFHEKYFKIFGNRKRSYFECPKYELPKHAERLYCDQGEL